MSTEHVLLQDIQPPAGAPSPSSAEIIDSQIHVEPSNATFAATCFTTSVVRWKIQQHLQCPDASLIAGFHFSKARNSKIALPFQNTST